MDGIFLAVLMTGIFFVVKYANKKLDESDKKHWEQ